MKVKLKTIMAGPGGGCDPGSEIDVDKKTADALIDGGFAQAIEPEAAVIAPQEKAVKPRVAKRGKK